MIKLLSPLFILLSLSASLVPHKKALDSITLENSGDYFSLTEESFAKDQGFAFTSVANFQSGQACGLVFGAEENSHYWVFNADRGANRTKLLYFETKAEGGYNVTTLISEPIIGNDKTTQSEYNMINPKMAVNPRFHLKVVLSYEEEKTYAEFFIDNIKRFGTDVTIDLNTHFDKEGVDYNYEGGYLGYNVFNSKVTFTDTTIGENDYSYYTEQYRNQFHYSQFSHWNNDPNGLVYYDGWYHMYYQTHPYSKFWDHMYWGHARSRDLIHWQELPIALFPDDGTMGKGLGHGYAWSGAAMVYRPGMSDAIDALNWFPNGEGTGLIGFYTRDGERQDQVIISSDDSGFTWTKRELISQHLMVSDRKVDCRDPSLFPVKKEGDKVTLWGMVLSGGTQNKIWFLKSPDLVNWSYAGEFNYTYPECITMSKVKTLDNSEEHYAMTVSSRHYAIGDFTYDEATGHINFILADNGVNVATLESANSSFKKMDYAEDSYAAQSFYIDDERSKYYGESVSISWFSGLPSDAESGEYAQVRDPWNGGGMTIPVKLGIDVVDGEYLLTQRPITENNTDLNTTPITELASGTTVTESSDILGSVDSQTYEMKLTTDTVAPIEIRVNVSEDEYTAFGWNEEDGYYFDRSFTSDGGINFKKNYHHTFTTGPIDNITSLSWYVLVDKGGVEVFSHNYRYNFYGLTLANFYATNADIIFDDEIIINEFYVNEINSIWHNKEDLKEGILTVNKEHIDLDLTLGNQEEIIAYSSTGDDVNWEIVEGEEVIEVSPTKRGAMVTSKANGKAKIKASANGSEKFITVSVEEAEVDVFFNLESDNIHSGSWRKSSQGLIAQQTMGDGFIFSNEEINDGTITATFDLTNADAAGILLRANRGLTSFIMVNYDKVINACKIWSQNGEIARESYIAPDLANVTLTVTFKGSEIELSVGGTLLIKKTLDADEPRSGLTGLNVCGGKVIFKSVTILKEEYTFNNTDLVITNSVDQYIKSIYNITNKNELVNKAYYSTSGQEITLKKEYFALLEENKTYSFRIEGAKSSFTIDVIVTTIEKDYAFEDINIQEGLDVTVYVGTLDVTSLTINDVDVDVIQNNDTILIKSTQLVVGENVVTINDEYTFTITVIAPEVIDDKPTNTNNALMIGLIIGGSSLAVAVGALTPVLLKLKKKGPKK